MSGIGEASLVLGLISSAITVFEAVHEIYTAVSDAQEIPKKLRVAVEQLPLIHNALSLAYENVKAHKVDEQGLQSAKPILERCIESASNIRDIFEKNIPGPGASRSERLKKFMGLKLKSKKVKNDMKDVVKDMELLAQHQLFQSSAVLEDIRAAVSELSGLSDEEHPSHFIHSGAGAINANTGLGRQENYNNSGSGSQYNADRQYFGRDQVDHQNNVSYHYYLKEDRTSLVHDSSHGVDSPHSQTASEKGFLATIGPHREIDVPEKVAGTCLWLIETIQYQSWVQSSQSSILWITGGAGTGKTTLTNHLIEHTKQGPEVISRSSGFCSFFCSRDIEGQHDVGSILQDLVLQLIEDRPKVLRVIKSKYGMMKQDHPRSFVTLWRMFETAIDLLPSQEIYIMIDALDECDDDLRSRLLQKLAKLLGPATNNLRSSQKTIKVVISCQPQTCVAWNPSQNSIGYYHIDIENAQYVGQDVQLVVDHKITELIRQGVFSESDGRDLRRVVTSKSENSFLWLTVVFQHVESPLRYSRTQLEDILSQTSQSLQQIYARRVPPIKKDQIPLLTCYLRMLIASSRPLRFAEIDIFTRLQEEKLWTCSSTTAEIDKLTQTSLRKALGPLVRFPHGTAQLIHSTVKEFFMLLSQQPVHNLHTTHGTDLSQAHLFCFRMCAKYLSHGSISRDLFNVVVKDMSPIEGASPVPDDQSQDGDVDDLSDNFFDLQQVRFLRDEEAIEEEACVDIGRRLEAYDYSATNWTYHLAKSEDIAEDDDVAMAIELLTPASGHLENWYRYVSQQSQLRVPRPSESSPIVLAAMFNLTKPLHVLYHALRSEPPLPVLSSALYWAASRNSIDTVKLLLDYGAPVSSGRLQRLPLVVAARGNFYDICKHLLATADVNPNQIDYCGQSALHLAAAMDHVDVTCLLLSHSRIEVNLPDSDGRTALIAACRNGSIDSVRALRQDGRADVNALDMQGQSPLLHASKNNHGAIIKELIEFGGINLGMADKSGRNAISLAAQAGHLSVVEELHRMGLNAASLDLRGRNALSWATNSLKATEAADGTGESVLKYLVRKYPNEVDVPDEWGWTPLAWALDPPGYVKSVLTLTHCPSVDVNRRDEAGGKCILAWAASAGMTGIVQCLLHRPDLEVDQPSFSGQTALTYAAGRGMTETVRLLLEVGKASPRHLDHYDRTPVDWAEMNGFDEIAALLRASAGRAD